MLLGGKLVWGDGLLTCDCVIRDLSVSGARVKGAPPGSRFLASFGS